MRLRLPRLASLLALLGCADLGVGSIGDVVGVAPAVPSPAARPLAPPEPPSQQSENAVTISRCGLTGGDAHWVEEGQEVVVTLSCMSGLPLDPESLSLRPIPPGARWEPARAELRWVPGLDQAGVYHLTAATVSGETARIKIGVADRFDHPRNVPIALPSAYTEEMGLPVFHLTVDPNISAQAYTPATLVYRGRVYKITAKHKGNSSLAYPKKSYTLEFPKAERFNEPELAGGFLNKRKVVLRATFDDNSYLRDRLSYELWNRIGSGKIEIQTFGAVVYLNGVFQGLYTVVDHIDQHLMEAHGLDPKGNIFKGAGPDANFHPHPRLSDVYEKTHGTPPEGQPGAYEDLEELTRFINEADEETFSAEISRRVNVGEYTAWLIVATLIQAQDTFGKNSYQYHNPAGGPWRAVPWDWNHSFGQDWMTARETPYVPPGHLVAVNRLFQRLWHDPVLGPDTRERYRLALEHEVALEDILDLFDGMADEIAPSARRDERRWRQQYLDFERWSSRTDFTDFDGELRYMRQWIRDRWTFVAETL